MNEEVLRSRALVSRRRALGLGGTIGLGGLLAACGTAGERTSSAASSTASTATTSPTANATVSTAATTSTPSEIMALLNRAGTCSLAQEETQGPYWFDVDSIRTDIREQRPGTTLQLVVRVQDMSKCSTGGEAAPVANSVVEIWHCDAGGAYSGFESGSAGGGGAPPSGGSGGAGGSSGGTSDGTYSKGDSEATPTDQGTYLRGAQVTGADGTAQFTTIYPGWYRGRTVHIHLKVHIDKMTVLTTQLFMDESLNDAVFATSPYSDHSGRDTTNDNDSIFDRSGLLAVQKKSDGYLGVINLGVNV